MSLLSHQSAINQNRNFWLKANISSITANSIIADNAFINNVSSGSINSGSINTNSFNTDSLNTNLISSGIANIGNLNTDYISSLQVNTGILNASEGSIFSISTNIIDLDGANLTTATGNELLLNGVPIATTANLSSIQDWALFPAVSSIITTSQTYDVGQSNLPFRTGYFSTIVCKDVIAISTVLTIQETVSSLYVNDVFASTVSTQYVNTSNLNVSSMNNFIINSASGNFSTLNARNGNFSSLFTSSLAASSISTNYITTNNINTNTINGSTISGILSNWSIFPAITDVNINGNNVNNFTNMTGSNINARSNIQWGGFANPVPPFNPPWLYVGSLNSNGNITTTGNINAQDADLADVLCDNLDVGTTVTRLGDLNVYGDNNVPGDSALYVDGGVQFNGGFSHGFNAGAGPVAGINTTRIDLTAAGLGLTSATFITEQAGGAISLASGGATSIASGGAVSIASGNYLELNANPVKINNNGAPIIFNANTGSGNPGGLSLGASSGSSNLELKGLNFGAMKKYVGGANAVVDHLTQNSNLASFSLPELGQWYVKQTYRLTKTSGNAKDANFFVWLGDTIPDARTDNVYWGRTLFAPAVTSIVSTGNTFTLEGKVYLNTVLASTIQYGSTVIENISSFISSSVNPSPPPSTLSTIYNISSYTSTIYSTIVQSGGIKLFADGLDGQNTWSGELEWGDLLASYLGSRGQGA